MIPPEPDPPIVHDGVKFTWLSHSEVTDGVDIYTSPVASGDATGTVLAYARTGATSFQAGNLMEVSGLTGNQEQYNGLWLVASAVSGTRRMLPLYPSTLPAFALYNDASHTITTQTGWTDVVYSPTDIRAIIEQYGYEIEPDPGA